MRLPFCDKTQLTLLNVKEYDVLAKHLERRKGPENQVVPSGTHGEEDTARGNRHGSVEVAVHPRSKYSANDAHQSDRHQYEAHAEDGDHERGASILGRKEDRCRSHESRSTDSGWDEEHQSRMANLASIEQRNVEIKEAAKRSNDFYRNRASGTLAGGDKGAAGGGDKESQQLKDAHLLKAKGADDLRRMRETGGHQRALEASDAEETRKRTHSHSVDEERRVRFRLMMEQDSLIAEARASEDLGLPPRPLLRHGIDGYKWGKRPKASASKKGTGRKERPALSHPALDAEEREGGKRRAQARSDVEVKKRREKRRANRDAEDEQLARARVAQDAEIRLSGASGALEANEEHHAQGRDAHGGRGRGVEGRAADAAEEERRIRDRAAQDDEQLRRKRLDTQKSKENHQIQARKLQEAERSHEKERVAREVDEKRRAQARKTQDDRDLLANARAIVEAADRRQLERDRAETTRVAREAEDRRQRERRVKDDERREENRIAKELEHRKATEPANRVQTDGSETEGGVDDNEVLPRASGARAGAKSGEDAKGCNNKCRQKEKKKTNKDDVGVEGANSKRQGSAPHQIKFYTGIELEILRLAVLMYRIYLLTKNAFPNNPEQVKAAKKFFHDACKKLLGQNYRSMDNNIASKVLTHFLLDIMPVYTSGMSRLVCPTRSSVNSHLTSIRSDTRRNMDFA